MKTILTLLATALVTLLTGVVLLGGFDILPDGMDMRKADRVVTTVILYLAAVSIGLYWLFKVFLPQRRRKIKRRQRESKNNPENVTQIPDPKGTMQTVSYLNAPITYSSHPDIQTPFDAAVIITTLLRPSLIEAVKSVYAQENTGRIQILIGVDKSASEGSMPMGDLELLIQSAPGNVAVTFLNPGYSTSERHGGIHENYSGGAIHAILSFLANSHYLTYLDDDNWYAPNHIASLKNVIGEKPWAFTHRYYVHEVTGAVLVRDNIESLGPERGIHVERFGGFVDTNCYMLHKPRAQSIFHLWSTHVPGDSVRMSCDRRIFNALRETPYGDTGMPTVYYRINPADGMHPTRLESIPEEIRELHYGKNAVEKAWEVLNAQSVR